MSPTRSALLPLLLMLSIASTPSCGSKPASRPVTPPPVVTVAPAIPCRLPERPVLHELPGDEIERIALVGAYWKLAEAYMSAAEACLEARSVRP